MAKRDKDNLSPESPRFVLVGHCGPDMHLLRNAVQRAVRDAHVAVANDAFSLERELVEPGRVLLINRVLDDGFETDSGVALIASLSARQRPPVMMLISNYPEAVQAAVEAGARPGFGKASLYAQATMTALRDAAEAARAQHLTEI